MYIFAPPICLRPARLHQRIQRTALILINHELTRTNTNLEPQINNDEHGHLIQHFVV